MGIAIFPCLEEPIRDNRSDTETGYELKSPSCFWKQGNIVLVPKIRAEEESYDFRNIPIHEYRQVDLEIVWPIVKDDLPDL